MASPIGNLIHPPDTHSHPRQLHHSYSQSHPQHQHPHPHLHPHPHPHPHPHSHAHQPLQAPSFPSASSHHSPVFTTATSSASNLSLAPLNTSTIPSVSGPRSAPESGHGLSPAEPPPPTPQSASTIKSNTAQLARSHASSQSLYQCADCLRRYSRPEHLQRHIATHTLGKRFTCDICSKAFSRADLLKRHRANHNDDNGTKRRRISSSPGQGRVAHACQACAKARVKCEEMKPCSRCKTRGLNCESASSEDAAMHLLHLSTNPHPPDYKQESSPVSSYHPPPPASPRQTRFKVQQAGAVIPLSSYPPPPDSQAVNESPVIPGNPLADEESQLPTPETLMDQSNPDSYQPSYPNNDVVDVTRLPFSDFLHDVLYDRSLSNPARLAEAQGLAVLDFCDDANLELKDIDFGLLDHWNLDELSGRDPTVPDMQFRQVDTVDITAMRSKLVKIWTESPWRWSPGKTDTCYTEQTNLPLPSRDISGAQIQETTRSVDRVIKEKLQSSGRDRILGIVLSTCRNNSIMTRVASSFPSTDAMDDWIHIFLASHLCSVSAWIHYGSFSLNTQWPEWLAMAASAGAVLAPIPALRRFGFALQEAVRVTIPTRFEENNSKVADIGLVQALVLVQDVGLWSGNRRKMEIAECHLSVPIAMMRYRGKFQRSSYPSIIVDPSDEGRVLEEKWKRWYELESWKRLVFHAYLRDAQVSMTQFCNPSMSYAELTLPLPCSKELWFSRTAEEFKIRYLEVAAAEGKRPPSLGDLLRDINLLSANHQRVDVQYAISIYLHGFWSLIWEYRQLNAVYRSTAHSPGFTANPNLLLNSRHEELCRLLQNFQLVTHDWHEMLSAQESIVLHLLLMNLLVSLDDLQLFSGKEGEEQARRVYPVLQRWSDSYEARQALWHAGQILRQAKMFPPGHLKDFYAVTVHHAALCLWTHGVVSKATRPRPTTGADRGGVSQQQHQHQNQNQPPDPIQGSAGGADYMQQQQEAVVVVYLDGDDAPLLHRYISSGQGLPAIRGPDTPVMMRGDPAAALVPAPPATESLLEDPQTCMEVAQEILRANFIDGRESLPPISENIIHLLKQLGNAAWAVGLG
ncbi:hypothetical protein B0H66DRAFT_20445 [Apodospora peruviana]|uniref:C6 transcription factor RegA n=1 Tax=Apodospora peruviana TaxID=516989 RepID=A0AAE0MFQ7_9PEZI|nr:hypothetical protein B0H66DRAFT_20445 [Apodospora peruviana]